MGIASKKFGRLTAVKLVGKDKYGHIIWEFLCDCGSIMVARATSVRSGDTKSCGCVGKARNIARLTSHGMYGTPIYSVWRAMKTRCLNKDSHAYVKYGARGITVCDEWLTFEGFYKDMGERPEGMSIDRIDNDGGYEPGNCRWATSKEQCQNRRNNKLNTEAVKVIKYAHKYMGASHEKLATLYKIDRSLISRILSGKYWANITIE